MDDELMREIDEHLELCRKMGHGSTSVRLLQRARDRLDQQKWALMEIRGLVRPIIQNAPFILEHATPPDREE